MTEMIIRAYDHPLSVHGGKKLAKPWVDCCCNFIGLKWSLVKDYIRNCGTCKTLKAPNPTLQPLMGKALISDRVFQRLYIDLIGSLPQISRQKHCNNNYSRFSLKFFILGAD